MISANGANVGLGIIFEATIVVPPHVPLASL